MVQHREALTPQRRLELEELLMEPLMVNDPLINVQQAAAVLTVSADRVRDLARSGRLATVGGPHAWRRFRLSDVLALVGDAAPLTVSEAAERIGVTASVVRRFLHAGLLVSHGGSYPIAAGDIDALAEQRRGWLSVAAAADRLQVSPDAIHAMLEDGILGFTGDVSRPVSSSELDVFHG